jgi:hypothetical protein
VQPNGSGKRRKSKAGHAGDQRGNEGTAGKERELYEIAAHGCFTMELTGVDRLGAAKGLADPFMHLWRIHVAREIRLVRKRFGENR